MATIQDQSTYNHDGTTVGDPDAVAGYAGAGIDLNGVDQYITTPDSTNLEVTQFTVMAWVYLRGTGSTQAIWCNWDSPYGYWMKINTSDQLIGAIGNGSSQTITAPDPLPLNTFSHCTFTFDGSLLKLYVNGRLVAQQDATTSVSFIPDCTAVAGALSNNNGVTYQQFLNGILDELYVYSVPRTQCEINTYIYDFINSKNFEQKVRSLCPVHYWKFDETSGTEVFDDTAFNESLIYSVDASTINTAASQFDGRGSSKQLYTVLPLVVTDMEQHWTMATATSALTNEIAGGFTLPHSAGVTFTGGSGGLATFNGVDEDATRGDGGTDSLGLRTTSYSIYIKFRPEQLSYTTKALFCYERDNGAGTMLGWSLRWNGSGNLVFDKYLNSGQTADTLTIYTGAFPNTTDFYDIVITVTPTAMKGYVNGSEVDTLVPTSNSLYGGTHNCTIASAKNSSGVDVEFSNITVDDAKWWDRELSADEANAVSGNFVAGDNSCNPIYDPEDPRYPADWTEDLYSTPSQYGYNTEAATGGAGTVWNRYTVGDRFQDVYGENNPFRHRCFAHGFGSNTRLDQGVVASKLLRLSSLGGKFVFAYTRTYSGGTPYMNINSSTHVYNVELNSSDVRTIGLQSNARSYIGNVYTPEGSATFNAVWNTGSTTYFFLDLDNDLITVNTNGNTLLPSESITGVLSGWMNVCCAAAGDNNGGGDTDFNPDLTGINLPAGTTINDWVGWNDWTEWLTDYEYFALVNDFTAYSVESLGQSLTLQQGSINGGIVFTDRLVSPNFVVPTTDSYAVVVQQTSDVFNNDPLTVDIRINGVDQSLTFTVSNEAFGSGNYVGGTIGSRSYSLTQGDVVNVVVRAFNLVGNQHCCGNIYFVRTK